MRFTKTAIAALPAASPGKRDSYRDTHTPGLELRVTDQGTKTFVVLKKFSGKTERVTIGRFPEVTVEAARAKCMETLAAYAHGDSTAGVRRALRGEPTFGELFTKFLAGKPLAESTKTPYRTTVNKHLGPLLKLKASQVDRDAVRALKITSPSAHNRCRAIIGAVFKWSCEEGLIDLDSPARAMRQRKVKSRDRFIQPEEVAAFLDAVSRSRRRDLWLLLLFTGARLSNVLEMRWDQIDLERGTWTIPKTKNGEALLIPLVDQALYLLTELNETKEDDCPWVFEGRKGGALKHPRRAWLELLDDAGLPGLRIHDLRRTLGSWQARSGTSLTLIGKSLGHKSLAATQVYARTDAEPIRGSVQAAITSLLDAAARAREEAEGSGQMPGASQP